MILYYLLALASLCFDQLMKWGVATYMLIGESLPVIPGVLNLTSHRNRGAAFGMLQNQRLLFLVVATVAVVAIAVILKRVYRSQRMLSTGLALVMGGALGNLIDRSLKGEVVDMFDLQFVEFPIFNVADCSIVIGAALIILSSWLEERERKAMNG